MKLVLPAILSIFTVVSLTNASESLIHPSPIEQEALRRLEVSQKYSNPETAIPEELRTIFDPTAEQIKEKPSLGAGIVRAFRIEAETYVIYGMRFGKTAKISIGGSVEPNDQTIEGAICRELAEEFFGQLPLANIRYADEKLIAGGFHLQENGKVASEGWGPYLTFFAIELGYNFEQLENAVSFMNFNARLHFPVATFFSGIKGLQASDIQSQAQGLLLAFEDATGKQGIIPLKPETQNMLARLVENPYTLPDDGNFAKKYVHDYTEYSEFHLVPLADFMGLRVKKFSENESKLALKLLSNSAGIKSS
jgi:hypothetical protein